MFGAVKNDPDELATVTTGRWEKRFVDPQLEDEYQRQLTDRINKKWRPVLRILTPMVAVLIGLHWMLAPKFPSTLMATAELGLLISLLVGAYINKQIASTKHSRIRRRSGEFSFFFGTINCLCVLIVLAESSRPMETTPMAFIMIFIVAMAPNHVRYQILGGLIPSCAFIGIMVGTGHVDRFLVYNAVFLAIGMAYALINARQQDHAWRKAFFLKGWVEQERATSERLLHSILPKAIAGQLRDTETHNVQLVQEHDDVTVLFADLEGFTGYAANHTPEETVTMLGRIFAAFDDVVSEFQVEKIKSIGDGYMLAAGLNLDQVDHCERMVWVAIGLQGVIDKMRKRHNFDLKLRIGIHRGPVIAGVLGNQRFHYDLWGDTVNIASRLESHGKAGEIQVSEEVAANLRQIFEMSDAQQIELRNHSARQVLFIKGPKPDVLTAVAV